MQQELAVLAGEAAAAQAAADAAAARDSTLDDGSAALAVAVAKMRVGEAAGRGSKVAHQVHGAIGFTHEHELHYRTRRLWAWRDEMRQRDLVGGAGRRGGARRAAPTGCGRCSPARQLGIEHASR